MQAILSLGRDGAMAVLMGVAISLLLIFLDALFGSPVENYIDQYLDRLFASDAESVINKLMKENPDWQRDRIERIVLEIDAERKTKELEEQKAKRRNKLIALLASIAGVVSLILIIWRWERVLNLLGIDYAENMSWQIFGTSALAATGDPRPEVAALLPYIAAGILALMGLSFIIAIYILMFLPDKYENQARIKAADNIVKTFGGFFTGLATSLLGAH